MKSTNISTTFLSLLLFVYASFGLPGGITPEKEVIEAASSEARNLAEGIENLALHPPPTPPPATPLARMGSGGPARRLANLRATRQHDPIYSGTGQRGRTLQRLNALSTSEWTQALKEYEEYTKSKQETKDLSRFGGAAEGSKQVQQRLNF